MARWLIKSDPEEYAFADLVRHRRTRDVGGLTECRLP